MSEESSANREEASASASESPEITLQQERLRRWRLVLGDTENEQLEKLVGLSGRDQELDRIVALLYGPQPRERKKDGTAGSQRSGSLAPTAKVLHRWLGDVRRYFPKDVATIIQNDACEKFGVKALLHDPEILESLQPDIGLVATLLSMKELIPEQTKATARQLVARLVKELMERLANATRQAILGSLDRTRWTRRPPVNAIDWNRTIRLNLKNYQPEYRTVIPEVVVGFPRKQRHAKLKHIVLCVDQSGSMAESVVYAGILASVLASLPAVQTSLILFDTSVVDMTGQLHDPVELLFGVQLGGGTDIAKALAYAQSLIHRSEQTILVLISDLYEGGSVQLCQQRVLELISAGVQFITLLALDDSGQPQYDHSLAHFMAQQGIPCFACTPRLFPDMMAAAIQQQDLTSWATQHGLATVVSTQSGKG
jgi:Mg-chelatase subunit ChlD